MQNQPAVPDISEHLIPDFDYFAVEPEKKGTLFLVSSEIEFPGARHGFSNSFIESGRGCNVSVGNADEPAPIRSTPPYQALVIEIGKPPPYRGVFCVRTGRRLLACIQIEMCGVGHTFFQIYRYNAIRGAYSGPALR